MLQVGRIQDEWTDLCSTLLLFKVKEVLTWRSKAINANAECYTCHIATLKSHFKDIVMETLRILR